jgi:mono/diheme cytochrome c family protein
MRRLAKILALSVTAVAVAVATAACGTEKISASRSNPQAYTGAQIFAQRCAGCHTLSYAATHGSAPNVRTAQANSGPNFDQRCERPITRVLYAIANGGFSGAYMPQNIVVGQDAIDVAKFVATYAGRSAPREIGIVQCDQKQLGVLPSGSGTPSAGQPTATAAQIATSTTGGNTGTATETSATQTSTAP